MDMLPYYLIIFTDTKQYNYASFFPFLSFICMYVRMNIIYIYIYICKCVCIYLHFLRVSGIKMVTLSTLLYQFMCVPVPVLDCCV